MSTSFETILLPLDFTINTETVVKKAIELSDPEHTVIHLFHVADPSLPIGRLSLPHFHIHSGKGFRNKLQLAEMKLEEWRFCIMENFPGIRVKTHLVIEDSVQNAIEELAEKINPQIIIIGKRTSVKWTNWLNDVNTDKLASQTNCPVLTVRPGSLHNKTRIIVVPVGKRIPERKIDLLIELSGRFRAQIHLITLKEHSKYSSSQAFIETYRILKNTLGCHIELKVLNGDHPAREALRYAGLVGADMLLVNPREEATILTIPPKSIADILETESRLQILSIKPYPPLYHSTKIEGA